MSARPTASSRTLSRATLRMPTRPALAGFALAGLALLALGPSVVHAQQRDIRGLFDDAGEPAPTTEPAAPSEPTDPTPSEPSAVPPEETAPSALPEGHVPTVTVRLSPTEGLMTGDVVHYELSVEVPDGDDVNLPRQRFAPLELVGQDHTESVTGGRRRFVYTLQLLALTPGELTIPAVEVRVITADGVVGTVRTEPQTVSIGSLVANEPDAQPRPATEPVVVMQDDFTLAYLAGALALMAVTALLTWLFLRWWRARPKELPPPPPPRPAHEVALEKLRALRRALTGAVAEGDQPAIVDGASDALREYLGHRFGFNGLESTTDEVIGRMRQQRLAGVTLPEITALLGECDLVKFARAVPSAEDCERVIGEAERIVQRTVHTNVAALPGALDARAGQAAGRQSNVAAPTTPMPLPAVPATMNEPVPYMSAPPASDDFRDDADTERSTEPTATGADAVTRASSPALPSVVVSPSELSIPVTNPPPARASFAIPETPVPPPPPRDSDPDLLPPPGRAQSMPEGQFDSEPTIESAFEPGAALLAKANEALAKASEAAAKASEATAKASEVTTKASDASTAILGGLTEPGAEERVWDALEDAVAQDGLVVGEVVARREEGFLVALGAGVHAVLPEAQLGGLVVDGLVGQRHALRVVSLHAGKRRVVVSHRDVDAAAERALLGRPTPVGFSDPSEGSP